MTRSLHVILEGTDRSGKDSIWEEIDKQTRYSHYVQDRGPVGFLAYDLIYGKGEQSIEDHKEDIEAWAKHDNTLIIYLEASDQELERRCINTNHEALDFYKHKSAYEASLTYARAFGFEIHRVDTTGRKPKDVVKQLIDQKII